MLRRLNILKSALFQLDYSFMYCGFPTEDIMIVPKLSFVSIRSTLPFNMLILYTGDI